MSFMSGDKISELALRRHELGRAVNDIDQIESGRESAPPESGIEERQGQVSSRALSIVERAKERHYLEKLAS